MKYLNGKISKVTPIKKLRKLPVDQFGHPLDYVTPR